MLVIDNNTVDPLVVSLVSALDLPGAWLGEAGATPAASEPEVETEEGLALEKRAA